MRTRTKAALGTVGGALALWVGWGLYVQRSTERVPYETVEERADFEVRRYPQTLLVETTAPDAGTAFRRLFEYIAGENEAREDVQAVPVVATRGEAAAATEPVRTAARASAAVAMTAPVRTDRDEEGVTMGFYLPAEYGPGNAPVPTDSRVRLVVEPPQTLAVRRFSWYATEGRVARQRRHLLDALEERGIDARGDPVLLQYNDPWTPPFMRTNEIAVPVDEEATWADTDA